MIYARLWGNSCCIRDSFVITFLGFFDKIDSKSRKSIGFSLVKELSFFEIEKA